MKVAVIQFRANDNKRDNVQRAVSFVVKAIEKKAKFILLPEVFVFRGKLAVGVSEDVIGESIKPLMTMAKKYKVFILAGSIYEKVRGNRKKAYNTSIFINDQGQIEAKYRKIHLFSATIGKKEIKESACFLAGKKLVMGQVNKFKVGFSICYDLRFADLYWKYANEGAHVLCVPSAFTAKTGQAHWEILLRARAIENKCYVLAPNQVGYDGRGVLSYGHSMIIDPWGKILAEASADDEEIIYAGIDMNILKEIRMVLGDTKYIK